MMYKCIYAIIWTCTDMCLFLDKNWQTAYSCSVDKDLLVNLVCTVQMQHLFSPALVFTLRSENGYPTFSIYIFQIHWISAFLLILSVARYIQSFFENRFLGFIGMRIKYQKFADDTKLVKLR